MATKQRLQKIKSVAANRMQGVIVLEDIYDPHNAAAVLRTADAFGVQRVCFIFKHQKKFNPRKIGKTASSSANKWLDFEVFSSAQDCFKKLKRQGYTIVATVLDDKAKCIFKTKFISPKTALCFGNEHSGLSQEAIELADTRIYIPMQGFVQSMNLSVTAAICMYELFRQRQKSHTSFSLSKAELNRLIKNWKKL